jgi:hypothetical protein
VTVEININDVTALATSLGVELKLDTKVSDRWLLLAIKRTRDNPGAGAVVLRALHAIADKNCARIGLRAGDFTKRRHVKLVRYYEQFGYVAIHGNDMIRLPRSAWPAE